MVVCNLLLIVETVIRHLIATAYALAQLRNARLVAVEALAVLLFAHVFLAGTPRVDSLPD